MIRLPWPPRLRPCALLLTSAALLFGSVGAGVGRAAVIAPAPVNGNYNSRCAAITLSPQVVEVGQKITAHAGPPTDQCASKPKDLTWSWSVGGDVVSGCKTTGSTCVAKQTSPTDLASDGQTTNTYQWGSDCINGSSGFGGWSSCALYVVLDHQFEVSGVVTAPGSTGGIPGVKVQADCPHGGTATTDTTGTYRFALDRGDCTIRVVPPKGESANPKSRVVHVAHDIKHVDFEVGCGAGASAHIATAAASGGADCKLDVKIKTYGPGTTGLGWVPSTTNADGEFIAASPTEQTVGKCLSGCVNVKLTVTDHKTGEIVSGATVSAGVTPLPASKIASYPKGFQAGDGRICLASDPTDCGSKLQGLTTGPTGEVELLYWAPGVTDSDTVTLTVTAEDSCSASVCHTTRQFGKSHANIDLLPQKIVDASSTLGHNQTTALIDWADQDGFIKKIFGAIKDPGTATTLEKALEYAGKAFEVEIPGGLIFAGKDLITSLKTSPPEPLTTPLGQAQAVTGLFAGPFGLHTDGLGSVEALALDSKFVDAIAGKNGLMRKFAAFVKDDRDHRAGGQHYNTHLIIDEVSYCQDRQACGPGDTTPGIQPFVEIRFEATSPSNSNHNETHFEGSVVVPYRTVLFNIAQFGGKPPPLLH